MPVLAPLLLLSLGGAAPAPKPFKTQYRSSTAEFEYSWPSEVSAVPRLVALFRADMREKKAAIIAGGKEYAEMRKESGLVSGVPYQHSTAIETAGQSARLLSLRLDVYEFTGGAHGNYWTNARLWDRSARKTIDATAVFRSGSNFILPLRAAFCGALDEERKKRRGGESASGTSITEFDTCPTLSDVAFFPADEDKDGRFDHFTLVAAPYVAGPYAEGAYEIDVPVSKTLAAALKSEYRASFEIQPQ